MGKDCIYIAGPECFYKDGNAQLDVMRRRSESFGFDVSLPNDNPLKLDHADLRLNADAIFKNCANSMNRSTAIICDLEFYRGPDVDGGSVYELGMAYARGIRVYGYTRDKRPMVWKYQGSILKNGKIYDQKGRLLPYHDLPFSPNVIGATKIIEGDYDDCLQAMRCDIEEERKRIGMGIPSAAMPTGSRPETTKPIVFLAGPDRYAPNAEERYAKMKAACEQIGLYPITPLDDAPGIPRIESDDPYIRAANTFAHNQQHVRNCDILIANLNDFHGWEPDSDTSFECGMAFQLGKRLFGYMEDTRIMKDRVPHLGDAENRDACGCNVENFDYPINLMFASSMPLLKGSFYDALKEIQTLLEN